MAARIVLQQIVQNEQRRSRGAGRQGRPGRAPNDGLPEPCAARTSPGLFGDLGLGQEDDFLQQLKLSIEARVPKLHGAPAGTGGTGATGEARGAVCV